MGAPQDTSRSEAAEDAPGRAVFRVREGVPAAEAAEAIVASWHAGWEVRPPGLVLVPEGLHAALVEHLLARVASLAAAPADATALTLAMRAGLDDGATLVAGGRPGPGGLWLPTLFVNVPAGAGLLADGGLRGPVLCVARVRNPGDAGIFLTTLPDPWEEVEVGAASATA